MAVSGEYFVESREVSTGLDLDKYSSEIIRLGSFASWPDDRASIRPRKMAKAGLFYTGEGDKVTCFSCGGSLVDWSNYYDQPLLKHYQVYPECVFVKKRMEDEKGAVGGNRAGSETCPAASTERIETAMGRMKTLCDDGCPRDLNTEAHRLHTFCDWPDDTPVAPERLAQLGFFYLGTRDAVECAFCGGVLHQWEEGDDPAAEHAKHYPHCPFVSGCQTSNVPTDRGWCNIGQGPQENKSFLPTQIGSPTDGPKCPELASQELRLATFFRWPLYTTSPRRLAEAGFYYTNIGDQVKCFWCDGELKDWQPGGDPWTEHARWYGQRCGFVLRQRGMEYVTQTKEKRPPALYSQQVGNVQQVETSPKHFGGMISPLTAYEKGPTSDSEEEDMQCSLEALQNKLQRLAEERLCKVCRHSEACMVFIPCGHLCCCDDCASVLQRRRRKCPYCKERFFRVKRASLA